MAMSVPKDEHIVAFNHSVECVMRSAHAIRNCYAPWNQKIEDDCFDLADCVTEAIKAVKGNRADGTRPTWDDLRLSLAATLREVLDYLED
jgi:hypothetical protein